MTILLSQEDLDAYEEDTTTPQVETTSVEVVSEPIAAKGNILLSQEDLEQYGGVDKTQTLAHIDEANDPLFQDTESSMGRDFMYGFQSTPTDVENLALWLESKQPMPGWTHKYSLPSEEGDDTFKSVEALYGKDFISKSEDERREQLLTYRQTNLEREYPVLSKRGDDYERSWSEAIGSFMGMLATPTSLLPLGKGYKAASAIGAGLGFTYGATEGLAHEGEIDTEDTAKYTLGGAILSPMMIWGGRQVVSKFSNIKGRRDKKQKVKAANELLNTYESLVYESINKGEGSKFLLRKLNQVLGITQDELLDAVKLAERKVHIPTPKEARLYYNAIEKAGGKPVKPGGGVEKIFGVVSTRIKNISVPTWHRIRKLEYNQHARLHNNYSKIAPFLEHFSKVKGDEREILMLSLYNGEFKQVESLLKKQGNTDLLIAFKDTQKVLNKLHGEAAEAGLTLGYTENYFPRRVKDIDGLQLHFGEDKRNEILKLIEEAAVAKGSRLSKSEQADVINNYLLGSRTFSLGRFTSYKRERKIQQVTPELLKFYDDPEQALHTYIRRVVTETEKKKFFGNAWEKGGLDSTDVDESIARFLIEEQRRGNLKPGDLTELGELVQLRFGPGEQGPQQWIQNSKNILYAQTLGNVKSAVTQLGDIFLASYKNGIKPTVQALLSSKKIKLEDYGFTDIAEEFASRSKTSNFMRQTFKWGGFTRIDRLGKETLLNSSFIKYSKLIKDPKKMQQFRKKWRPAFGDDLNELVENLRAGDIDNKQVRLLLWHDLSDMQPVSLIEMPAAYLKSPDLRALYMLKTFTIKQFDIMRRDAFQLMKKKETRAEGVKNLIKYATVFTAGGMTSDSIKDWMMGRKYDVKDSAINTVWKLIGLNRYTAEKFHPTKGDPLKTLLDVADPPVNIWGQMLKDAWKASDFDSETEPTNKWIKGLPVVGTLAYEHLFGGKEIHKEKKDKERRGFRRGGTVSQMGRLSFNKGGGVSLDNTSISKESQILVDNETVPFVDRIINPQNYPTPAKNKDGSISTHLLSAEIDEEGTAYVFPTKTYKKSMVRRPEQSYTQYDDNYKALDVAKTEGNVIKFDSIDEAVSFSKNYKPKSFLDYYGQKPSFTERMSEDYSKREDASTQSYIDNKTGKISRFRRAINNVGNLAGLGFDVAGNLIESSVDTYLENLEAFAPKGYKKISKDLKEAKTWVLNTEAGQYAIEKATLGLKEYSNWKRDNPQDAQTFESVLNIGMGSWAAKGMASQMSKLKNQTDTLNTKSTYQYKPNSDTPYLDMDNEKINKVNKFFNPDVINKALQSKDKNTKVVYMTPGEFLTLAKTHTSGVETKKLDRINNAINEGIQLEDIPTLTIKAGKDGSSQVTKHDGRHRANALYELGEDLIPVRIKTTGNKDNKKLSTVTNEDGLEVYTFPNNVIYNRRHLGEAGKLKKENIKKLENKKREYNVTDYGGGSILIHSDELSTGTATTGPTELFKIELQENKDNFSVVHIAVVDSLKGQGIALELYKEAIKMAAGKGKGLVSDTSVSTNAMKVYKKLQQEGFDVTFNKNIESEGGGYDNKPQILSTNNKPVVTIKLKKENSKTLNASRPKEEKTMYIYSSSSSGKHKSIDPTKWNTATMGKGDYSFINEDDAAAWSGNYLIKKEVPKDILEKSINWGDGGQSKFVTKAFKDIKKEVDFDVDLEDGGIDVYPTLTKHLGEKEAHKLLNKHGIKGNKREGELAIFNPEDVKVIEVTRKKFRRGGLVTQMNSLNLSLGGEVTEEYVPRRDA